jgi:hypothetical protein
MSACWRARDIVAATLLAAKAGVACMDHADQFSEENMRLMRERQSFAAPTFTISEYFLTDIGALKRVTFVMKNSISTKCFALVPSGL